MISTGCINGRWAQGANKRAIFDSLPAVILDPSAPAVAAARGQWPNMAIRRPAHCTRKAFYRRSSHPVGDPSRDSQATVEEPRCRKAMRDGSIQGRLPSHWLNPPLHPALKTRRDPRVARASLVYRCRGQVLTRCETSPVGDCESRPPLRAQSPRSALISRLP